MGSVFRFLEWTCLLFLQPLNLGWSILNICCYGWPWIPKNDTQGYFQRKYDIQQAGSDNFLLINWHYICTSTQKIRANNSLFVYISAYKHKPRMVNNNISLSVLFGVLQKLCNWNCNQSDGIISAYFFPNFNLKHSRFDLKVFWLCVISFVTHADILFFQQRFTDILNFFS